MISSNICGYCQVCCKGEISGNDPCKHNSSTGCDLPWEERSLECRYYPYVIVNDTRYKNSYRILLDTGCPYHILFLEGLDAFKRSKLVPSITITLPGWDPNKVST